VANELLNNNQNLVQTNFSEGNPLNQTQQDVMDPEPDPAPNVAKDIGKGILNFFTFGLSDTIWDPIERKVNYDRQLAQAAGA
jgi:hypothetical protein